MSFLADRQGCGYLRIVFPHMLMNALKKDGFQFEADHTAKFINDTGYYKQYTLASFQRSATGRQLELIMHFKTNIRKITKTPIVYESDDDFFNIPPWNYASAYYTKNAENIKNILQITDGMTVSTEALKELYSPYCNKIVVIPNSLPKFLWGDILQHEPNTVRPRILYAGSENHFLNKHSSEYKNGMKAGGDFGDALIDFIRKTTDKYQWVFSGAYPLELEDLINEGKIERHPWQHILQYPKHVKSLNIDIWIAPLMKCDFNNSKSNIKALEATATGCPCIFSNATPYKDFMLTSDTENEIIGHIEQLAHDADLRKEVYDHDYNLVKEQLFWEENDNVLKYIRSHLNLFNKTI